MVCLPIPPLRRGLSNLLLFRRRRCGRSRLLLLSARGGGRGRRLPGGRLGSRLLSGRRLVGRRVLLVLLILLFRAFANHGRAAWLRDQDRQRQRRDHKYDGSRGRGFTEQGAGTARAEGGLSAATAEGAGPVRAFALLQEHDQDQKGANNNVKACT